MKCIVLCLIVASIAFAEVPDCLKEPVRAVVSLMQVTPALVKEIGQGAHQDMAIECKEGNALPLQLLYNTPLLAMSLAPNLSFKVNKTCYLRFVKKAPE